MAHRLLKWIIHSTSQKQDFHKMRGGIDIVKNDLYGLTCHILPRTIFSLEMRNTIPIEYFISAGNLWAKISHNSGNHELRFVHLKLLNYLQSDQLLFIRFK